MTTKTKRVSTGYVPRPLQQEIHQNLKRFNVLVCHRRFGKTVLCLNELIDRACRTKKKDARFAFISPLYRQSKDVAWTYLKNYTRNIPGVSFNEVELRCDLPNGSRIRLYGGEPDHLRGLYFDCAVIDEFAGTHPSLWPEVVRPALSDRKGDAIIIGTPQGHNAFYDIYNYALEDTSGEWYASMFKASESGVIDESELHAARSMMSEDEFEQEFECSFAAAIRGAYFGREMSRASDEGRITKIPHQSELPVHAVFDLGVSDATAIWFYQIVGRFIHLIHYYENSGEGIPHYVNYLQKLQSKGYNLGEMYAPHDIRVREWGTGKSRAEIARSLGLEFQIVPNLSLTDGIEAGRIMLRRCCFDVEGCKDGIEALHQYQKVYDDEKKIFRNTPLHNWASHGADAFRYLSLVTHDHFEDPKPVFERTFEQILTENDSLIDRGIASRRI